MLEDFPRPVLYEVIFLYVKKTREVAWRDVERTRPAAVHVRVEIVDVVVVRVKADGRIVAGARPPAAWEVIQIHVPATTIRGAVAVQIRNVGAGATLSTDVRGDSFGSRRRISSSFLKM